VPPPEVLGSAASVSRSPIVSTLRVLLNDYGGHAFTVELSRELARRGHAVQYVYSADFPGPKGDLLRSPSDAASFAVEALSTGERLQKYGSLAKRRRQERAFGTLMCRRIDSFAPDIVIGCNNPLEVQNRVGNHCRRRGIPFVFWLQDLHSEAIRSYLSSRITAPAGALIGTWYERMESRLLRHSSHIVAIADDFLPQLERWRVPARRVSVIENWALKNKIHVLPSDNPWRRAHGLAGKRVALYTGTIGLKHNPDLLLAAAESLRNDADAIILIVSEGKYANHLKDEATTRKLSNLKVLPFQPFGAYSEVLASGDVLLAMIEADASMYSVPSKVLSYLCSGRPIVLSAKGGNLAARTVRRSGAGVVADPCDATRFVAAVRHFLFDSETRRAAGARARAYAEAHFDITHIADRFEEILQRSCANPSIN
jgi:glycosyltransferase involved in cell wall biosynthesis